jgi:hypothetical protein
MNRDRSTEQSFNDAANRRAHEIARSSKETRQRIEAVHKDAADAKARKQAEQARRRAEDLREAQQKILNERQRVTYRPKWLHGKDRLTPEKMEALAERAVESHTAAELSEIEQRAERQIDDLLALERLRNPELDRERESVEAMREQKHEDRDATRVFEPGHEGSAGRERDGNER